MDINVFVFWITMIAEFMVIYVLPAMAILAIVFIVALVVCSIRNYIQRNR